MWKRSVHLFAGPSIRTLLAPCCIVSTVFYALAIFLPRHEVSTTDHWLDTYCTVQNTIMNSKVSECRGYAVDFYVEPGENISSYLQDVWAVERADPCSYTINETDPFEIAIYNESKVPCLWPESKLVYAVHFRCDLNSTRAIPAAKTSHDPTNSVKLLAKDCTNEHAVIIGEERLEIAEALLNGGAGEQTYHLHAFFLITGIIISGAIVLFWLVHVCYGVMQISVPDAEILLDSECSIDTQTQRKNHKKGKEKAAED